MFGWFWNEAVWLPPNVTWAQLEATENSHGKFCHLWYPIPAALILIVLRWVFERCAARPLGIALGVRPTRQQHRKPPAAAANDTLEAAAEVRRQKLSEKQVKKLANQLDMTEREVERWIRIRKQQNRPTTLQKFGETGWRCCCYSILFSFGLATLWRKPWLWDIGQCWYDYPNHVVEPDVWWYYMVEMTLYWSLIISQFSDAKRKDFWEMFAHHIITLSLQCFSWTCNLTRVGTLVMVIHDVADIFLEAAKMFKYANYQRSCDVFFASFAITWIVTRLGVFPTWILYSTTIEAPQILEMFPAYYIFNGLLSTLLVLHVVWTYFILKLVYKAMYSGKTEKDSRSDSSDESVSSSLDDSSSPVCVRGRQDGGVGSQMQVQANGDFAPLLKRTSSNLSASKRRRNVIHPLSHLEATVSKSN